MKRQFLLHHPDGASLTWEVPEDGNVYFSDGFAHVTWDYDGAPSYDPRQLRVIPESRILYYEEKP